MRVQEEWELASVLVCAVRAVVVRVLSIEIRLIFLEFVIPFWMSAIAVDMMSVVLLDHILKDVKFATFRNIEGFESDAVVEDLVAVELVLGLFACEKLPDLAVLLIDSILDAHRPVHIVFRSYGATRPLAYDSDRSLGHKLQHVPACAGRHVPGGVRPNVRSWVPPPHKRLACYGTSLYRQQLLVLGQF